MKLPPLLLALLPAITAGGPVVLAQPPAAPPAPPPPAAVRVLPTGGLRAETAALLLSGQEGGNLPFAALALPLPSPGGEARVPIVVEVDGPALLAGHEEGPLRVEICVYALGVGGGVLSSLLDTVVIPLAELDRLEKSGLKFQGELHLPAGEASLRILVKNPATGALGLKRLTLAVPSFHEDSAILLPPLFPEPGGVWLAASAAEGVSPLPEGVALPSARPVLVPEREVRFLVLAYHFHQDGRLAVELRRRDGEPKTELPVRLDRRASAADLEVLSVSFTPHGIEPGEYELRLVAPATTGEIRAAALPVIVSPDGAGRVWAALTQPATLSAALAALAAGSAGAAAGTAEAPRHRRFASSALAAAFRQALQPLAAGDEAGAQAAVAAFETTHLLTDRPPLPPDDLAEVEGRVARDLAKRDPEALVPVLMLFERLYHETLGRRAYLLSTHDGEVVLALTALYVKQSPVPVAAATAGAVGSPVPPARSLAAGFLVGLARGRLEGGVNSFCRRALERALTYDPGNEAALLALAVDAGRRGNPREAAERLEQLLRQHPESLEGRLRLALAEARLGHPDRARRRLGEIVAAPPATGTTGTTGSPGEPWLLSLAYQELARLERSDDTPGAAAQVLEEGLARLPGDGGLLLEKAALLDRRGEHGQAREILEAVQAQAEGGSTPRHRYNLPPEAAFDRAWSALEAGAAERRPAFGAAVAERAAKGQP